MSFEDGDIKSPHHLTHEALQTLVDQIESELGQADPHTMLRIREEWQSLGSTVPEIRDFISRQAVEAEPDDVSARGRFVRGVLGTVALIRDAATVARLEELYSAPSS